MSLKWTVCNFQLMIFVIGRLPNAVGYGDGAPRLSCKALMPIHSSYKPQQTLNPYQLQLLNDIIDYRCGDVVKSKFLVVLVHVNIDCFSV